MPRYTVATSRGLRDTLFQELSRFPIKILEPDGTAHRIECSWKDFYRLSLELRSATRLLLPVLDFPAYKNADLYHNVRKHDFTKYIDPHQSVAVEATVSQSTFKDQRFVAMKVKDALVDQFREKCGERPSVDTENPALRVVIRVHKNQASVALDTVGGALSHRGYRTQGGSAPLREHLAAGLVQLTGWTPDQTLMDPMCGSGTFLIEAALMGHQVAPGTLRKSFAFQKWKTFQEDAWSEALDEVIGHEKPDAELSLYGSDVSGRNLSFARKNAERAGVEESIRFLKKNINMLKPPEGVEPGVLIVNPPYGERLGVTHELQDLYRDLGYTLKQNFKGWDCWILSGNDELSRELKLKATQKIPVFNGQIECRFLNYKIRNV